MIWGLAIFSTGLFLGMFIVAAVIVGRRADDADDARLWDPEDCRHPPLRFPEGVPFQ